MRRALVGVLLTAAAAATAQEQATKPAETQPQSTVVPTNTAGERPVLLVSTLEAQGTSAEEAQALTQAVASTLEQRGVFKILTVKDIELVLAQERNRQMLTDCEANPQRCGADLGAVTGSRFVLSGTLARIGSVYELTLQVVDTVKAERLGRATRLAKDLVTLRLLLPYLVAEATGTPLPPPPARWLQFGLIAAGSASLIGGGTLGMLAIGRQQTLNDELCPTAPFDQNEDDGNVPDSCDGVNLRPREFYVEQDRAIGAQKTWALALMVAGAGMAAAGLYFMPPEPGGPRVALVPSVNGFALVGEWP